MISRCIVQRTRISSTDEERRALDIAARRTGRSLSSLIRDALEQVYGSERSVDDDLAAMHRAFGACEDRNSADLAIAATVLCTKARLLTGNVRHFTMFLDLQAPC